MEIPERTYSISQESTYWIIYGDYGPLFLELTFFNTLKSQKYLVIRQADIDVTLI